MHWLVFGILCTALQGVAAAAGPFGGAVTALQLDADDRALSWAATTRGLFHHRDGAWHRVPGMAHRDLRQVLTSSQRLLVVGADGSLLSSPDAGATWSPAARIRGRYGHQVDEIYALVADPDHAAHWFLGTAGDGPFETRDQGASWQPLSVGLDAEPPQAYHAEVLLPPRGGRPLLMGTRGRGLFAYRDGRWMPQGGGLPASLRVEALAEDPSDPDHLALGSRGAGLWESRDAGAHWAVVRKGSYGVVGPVSIGADGAVLAHFPEEGLVTVRDNKASRPGSLRSSRIHVLVAREEGGWFAGLDHDGVLEISPTGEVVGSCNEGLVATRIVSFGPGTDDGSLWVGDTNGVFFSPDGGASWAARDAGLLGASANVLSRSGSDLFLGSGGQGVYRWVSEAEAWESRSTGLGTANTIFSFAEGMAGQSFYVGTEGGVLRSDDRGGLWTRKNAGLTAAGEWRVAASPARAGRVWAAGGGTLYRSEDRGDTWAAVGKARPVALLATAFWDEEELLVLEDGRLSRLTDGETLAPMFEAEQGERFNCVLPLADTLWVGGSHGLWFLGNRDKAKRVWDGAGVVSLHPAPDGGLYLGTDGAGVVEFPPH